MAAQLQQLGELKLQMAQMQQQLDQNQVDQGRIRHVQHLVNEGILKDDGKGVLMAVVDPDESEMFRLSEYEDAESQQVAQDLFKKVASKRKAKIFHTDGGDKDKVEVDNVQNSEMI